MAWASQNEAWRSLATRQWSGNAEQSRTVRCQPHRPTYVPSPSVSYFRCFILPLICTFVVSYFLHFIVSQFRYFTLQLFHTLWFRPFRTGPLFADTYISRYLCSRSLCSPVPGTYISQWYLLSLFPPFIDLHLRCFELLLFCTFVV